MPFLMILCMFWDDFEEVGSIKDKDFLLEYTPLTGTLLSLRHSDITI